MNRLALVHVEDDLDKQAIRYRIAELGRDLIRLEHWTADAYARRSWVRVGELLAERDAVRERRSELMREIWRPTRRV